jgi:putative transposase
MKYRRECHSVTLLYTHLVYVTKYRKNLFNLQHLNRIQEVVNGVAKKMNFKVVEFNGESNHVHILIEYPPKLSISQITNSLKGVSSRYLRKEYPELKKDKALWSPSYFAVSSGGCPIETLKEYIQNQKKPS